MLENIGIDLGVIPCYYIATGNGDTPNPIEPYQSNSTASPEQGDNRKSRVKPTSSVVRKSGGWFCTQYGQTVHRTPSGRNIGTTDGIAGGSSSRPVTG